MAISLARARRVGQKRTTSKKMAKDYAAQQKKAKSRGFLSGILGKGLGAVLGSGLMSGLTIASGGLLAPLIMASSTMLGKKAAHEMTRGMAADPSKISKGDIYGYGKDESEALRAQLKGEMTVDPWKERGGFGKELLSSYVSAGMAGELSGVKGALQKGGGKDQLLGVGKYGTGAKGTFGERFKSGVGDLFGTTWGEGEGSGVDVLATTPRSQADTLLTTGELDQSELFGDNFESVDPNMAYDDIAVSEEIYAQGGQVPDQQQLMQLLALAQMQNEEKAYDNTPLEEVQQPTISEVFESRGKTLGGNNINSLAQMMGK